MKRSRYLLVLIVAATFALTYFLLRAADLKVVLDGHVFSIAAPLGAAITTGFVAMVGIAYQAFLMKEKRTSVMGMFGNKISPELVERMEAGEPPQLGGREVEMTAYFSDLQGFASFSARLAPNQLLEVMNDYLTACTDIIQEEGGTLDKYIGDAIIAMFGAPIAMPDHAYRACVASQRAQLKLGELRTKWQREGERWPPSLSGARMRIGLNTGLCLVGNMGSRTRFNYPMMGANVNLAARMESGATSWGASTMCTESTRAECLKHGGDRVVFRPLGKIGVIGRSELLGIYEIVGLKETIDARTRECIGVFADGLAKYYSRDWDGAIAQFQQSAQLEPNVPEKTPGVRSNPSLVFLQTCQHYKAQPPPENWSGTYVMRET